VFKLVGLKPRSRKYPVIGQEIAGRRRNFKFRAEAVRKGIL
jgi:hypothetical protein